MFYKVYQGILSFIGWTHLHVRYTPTAYVSSSLDLEESMLQSRQKHFVVRMRSTFSASVRSITRCASFKVRV